MKNIIAQRVTEIRKKYNLTQKDLADKLDLKTSTVSGWELGTRTPHIDTLIEICTLFEIKISWFFNEDTQEELNPYALIIADAKSKKITAKQLQSLLDALGKQ